MLLVGGDEVVLILPLGAVALLLLVGSSGRGEDGGLFGGGRMTVFGVMHILLNRIMIIQV